MGKEKFHCSWWTSDVNKTPHVAYRNQLWSLTVRIERLFDLALSCPGEQAMRMLFDILDSERNQKTLYNETTFCWLGSCQA